MFATTPGQSDSFSIFMDSYVQEFGWSRTYISSLFAAATLGSGFAMFFAGRVVDRIGGKWGAILSAAILGIACWLLSVVASPMLLFVGFFLEEIADAVEARHSRAILTVRAPLPVSAVSRR